MKLVLEEGLPQSLVSREVGVHKHTLCEWMKRYRRDGEAGLQPRLRMGKTSAPADPLSRVTLLTRRPDAFPLALLLPRRP